MKKDFPFVLYIFKTSYFLAVSTSHTQSVNTVQVTMQQCGYTVPDYDAVTFKLSTPPR